MFRSSKREIVSFRTRSSVAASVYDAEPVVVTCAHDVSSLGCICPEGLLNTSSLLSVP